MIQNAFRFICLMVGLFIAALPAQAVDFKPYAGAGVGSFIIDAGVGSKAAFGGYGILGADLHENYGIELRFGTTGKTSGNVTVPAGQICPRRFQGECLPQDLVTLLAPTPASISIDWFASYLFKLQYPFAEAFRVYALIGATTFNAKFSFASPIPPTGIRTLSSTNTTFSFGGGVNYGIDNKWRAGLDAMAYANRANTSPGANFRGLDVWAITATATYGF